MSKWLNETDMVIENDRVVFRRIGWQVNGGPKDKEIIGEISDFDRSIPHGSFTPIYIELGD